MKTYIKQVTGGAIFSLVSGFCITANAGLYTFSVTDSGRIPQGGTVFATEGVVSGDASSITSVELTLKFNSAASLGTVPSIFGSLNLGTAANSYSVNLAPMASTMAGGNAIYDVTFNGTPGTPGAGFNGQNPNDTWGLVLWDNSHSGFENGLIGWSLDINPVPEPVNVALGVFGVVVVGTGVVRRYVKKDKAVSL